MGDFPLTGKKIIRLST